MTKKPLNGTKAPNVSPETMTRYSEIAGYVMNDYRKNNPSAGADDPIPPIVLAEHLFLMASREEGSISKSTFNQYRSALKHLFKSGKTESERAAYHILHYRRPEFTRPKGKRRKLRVIKDDEAQQLIDLIAERRSDYKVHAINWIISTRVTGLRPIEWPNAGLRFGQHRTLAAFRHGEYICGKPDVGQELETSMPVGDTRVALVCRNGKNSNGRAHSPYRHLWLDRLDDATLANIAALITQAVQAEHHGSWSSYYDNVTSLIRRCARDLWPGRDPLPSLYTFRHRFSSDAKAQAGLRGAAAMMGHHSTRSTMDYYGRKTSGDPLAAIATPADIDLQKVIDNAKMWRPPVKRAPADQRQRSGNASQ